MYSDKDYELMITPETKIWDMISSYPQLEEKLISIAPGYSKPKNPVLRKSLTEIISLKQVAIVSNVSLTYLISELRKEVGQSNESFTERNEMENTSVNTPAKIKKIYNATDDLEAGIHPLSKVINEISMLADGECFQLITPFVPAPLIEKVRDSGFNVKTEKSDENKFNTYIWK